MKLKYFSLFLLVFKFIHLNAQQKDLSSCDLNKYVSSVDRLYSVNDEIFNGCVYIPLNSKIKGTPYLYKSWKNASIFISDNIYNIPVKYDLINDKLITKAFSKDGKQQLLDINKFQVDSFKIGDSLFINSKSYNLLSNSSPIYLFQIYQGNSILLKSIKKDFISTYSDRTPYGKFSSIKNELILYNGYHLVNIKNRSSFLRQFDENLRHDIKLFFRTTNISIKKSLVKELQRLMQYCDSLKNE